MSYLNDTFTLLGNCDCLCVLIYKIIEEIIYRSLDSKSVNTEELELTVITDYPLSSEILVVLGIKAGSGYISCGIAYDQLIVINLCFACLLEWNVNTKLVLDLRSQLCCKL